MTRLFTICLAIWAFLKRSLKASRANTLNIAIIDISQSISTKLDFEEEKESSVSTSNSSKEDEDVEVKHTIVVSTRLKNNNRRGLHNDGENSAQTFSVGHVPNIKKEDSGEVPIIKGYKSVESTLIRTPDTRVKLPSFTDPVFVNRDIRENYGPYSIANNPSQWKPSSYFNNINLWTDDSSPGFKDVSRRRDWPGNRNQVKFHRTITDDGVREFYCRKCRELSNGGNQGCIQQRSNSWYYESTTPKIKIDGKIAKFN